MPAQSIQSEGRARIISNDGSSGNACNLPQLKVAAFPFFPFRFFFFFFFCAQQAAMFCVLWTFFFSRFHYNTVLYTHLQANCAPFGWLPSTATIENIKNQASNWSHSHFHIPHPTSTSHFHIHNPVHSHLTLPCPRRLFCIAEMLKSRSYNLINP